MTWVAPEQDEAWRGDEHTADWPEEAAGPEYHLIKRAGLPPDAQAT